MIVDTPFKPVTPWQWLEQDLTLFALYCKCPGSPRMIGTREQGWEGHCFICGEMYRPRKEVRE